MPRFVDFAFWWQHVYDSYAGARRNACNENDYTISMYNGFHELSTTFPTSCESSIFHWLNYQ